MLRRKIDFSFERGNHRAWRTFDGDSDKIQTIWRYQFKASILASDVVTFSAYAHGNSGYAYWFISLYFNHFATERNQILAKQAQAEENQSKKRQNFHVNDSVIKKIKVEFFNIKNTSFNPAKLQFNNFYKIVSSIKEEN